MFWVDDQATLVIKDGVNLVGLQTNTYALMQVSDPDTKFTMDGGTITGNYSTGGAGAVKIWASGAFVMNAGTISGNKAVNSDGGGVGMSDGGSKFTMNGGLISNNSATNDGGGVVIGNSCLFTMYGGEIRNNSGRNGGGVYIYSADFNKPASATGGIIRGNTSSATANTASATGHAVFNWPVQGGGYRRWIHTDVPATTAIYCSGTNYTSTPANMWVNN
jgi:hypothetical protein